MGRLLVSMALWSTLATGPRVVNDVTRPARDPDPRIVQGINPSTPTRRPAPRGDSGGWSWLADPRSAVLLTLTVIIGLGGGSRLLKMLKGRRLLARLAEPDVRPDEIAESPTYGREPLTDLFRLLGTAKDPAVRDAAGQAIATLWKADNLVAEEERALVRRGFLCEWKARRRYPRDLVTPIPITVEFGVPFLRVSPDEISPNDLSWSYKILGSQRASLEEFSPWTRGQGRASFTIDPRDFSGNGPHRLVLQARVGTPGFADAWEFDLPQIPFNFELDPLLKLDALLALDDSTRAEQMARSVRLTSVESDPPLFDSVGPDLVIRNPPGLVVTTPLPVDLAHDVSIEFEGIEGRFPGGVAIVSGQGAGGESNEVVIPLHLGEGATSAKIDHPGEYRLRATLTPNPHRGWAAPDVRSLWPGTITTDWITTRLIRR